MPAVTTAAGVNEVLLPAIRGGRYVTVATDSDQGRAELAGYTLALGTVGVPDDSIIVAVCGLTDLSGRTRNAAFLAVAKAVCPPTFAAHVAGRHGVALGPDEDIIIMSAEPTDLGRLVCGLVGGGGRPVNPAAN